MYYVVTVCSCLVVFFFFQAEDGIRDAQESRGLGDVYKRQVIAAGVKCDGLPRRPRVTVRFIDPQGVVPGVHKGCLLYTSDAADDLLCVDLGGRRIIQKKTQ